MREMVKTERNRSLFLSKDDVIVLLVKGPVNSTYVCLYYEYKLWLGVSCKCYVCVLVCSYLNPKASLLGFYFEVRHRLVSISMETSY